ncbi:protein of unknown function [Caballeronia sp. S22]
MSVEKTKGLQAVTCNPFVYRGRSERIRTFDPLIPNQMRYQAALRSDEPQIVTRPASIRNAKRGHASFWFIRKRTSSPGDDQ